MNRTDLENKVKELQELKQMANEVEKEITAIENQIKDTMTEENVTELIAGVFKIKWVPVTSSRFDSKGFKEVYQDLYNQFCKPIVSRRFTVGV